MNISCPKCETLVDYEEGEDTLICPECGYIFFVPTHEEPSLAGEPEED